MMRTIPWLTWALGGLFLAGCGGALLEAEDDGDHGAEMMAFEAASVTAGLNARGEAAPVRVATGFVRLGVLWDEREEGALEVRTSIDGIRWSPWARPQVVFAEGGAFAGHLDRGGAFYQYRVVSGRAAPSFIAFDPIARVPEIPLGPVPQEPAEEAGTAGLPPQVGTLLQGLSTPIGALTIHSRQDWGARPPRCSSSTRPHRATIHHTVTPTHDSLSAEARLRQIQNYHMDSRGWCDIGYNYLVTRDGRVWRGRGATTLGAHVSNANSGNVGISFVGTYTSTSVNAAQMCGAARLLARLRQDFPALALDRSNVKGHRQYGGTSCPGDALYRQIDSLVRKATRGCSAS